MCDTHKILIVDDDREIRDLLVGRLQTYGFAAVAVESGKDMFSELANGGYELVVLDIMLRGWRHGDKHAGHLQPENPG